MARVTVEDCIVKVPNRFELVLLAAQRARNVSAGAQITVDRDNDKNPVVALREIAEQSVDFKELEETLVKNLQRFVENDEPESDDLDLAALQRDVTGEATAISSERLEGDAFADAFASGDLGDGDDDGGDVTVEEDSDEDEAETKD